MLVTIRVRVGATPGDPAVYVARRHDIDLAGPAASDDEAALTTLSPDVVIMAVRDWLEQFVGTST